jgi:hypothetical protein
MHNCTLFVFKVLWFYKHPSEYTVIGMDWLRRTYVSGKFFATDYVNYVNFSGYKTPNLSRF